MATKPTDIPVDVYLAPMGVPGQPLPPTKLMRPTPLEKFHGRYGRRKELGEIRAAVEKHPMIAEGNYEVRGVNWGSRPDGTEVAVVTVQETSPKPQPPARPIAPPVQPKRTAVSRRHATKRR